MISSPQPLIQIGQPSQALQIRWHDYPTDVVSALPLVAEDIHTNTFVYVWSEGWVGSYRDSHSLIMHKYQPNGKKATYVIPHKYVPS